MRTTLLSILKRKLLFQLILAAMAFSGIAVAQQADVIGLARTLSAGQLVTWVQEHNPDIGRLESAIVEAKAMEIPAGSLDDPQLSYTIAPATIDGFHRSDGSARGVNQRVEISQRIPWPGTLSLQETQARYMTDAAEYRLVGRRLTLIEAVKQGFAEWYFVHKAIEINLANQVLLEDIQRIVESQYAAGRATGRDVLQAEVKQGFLQEQQLGLERDRLRIQAQLNAMLNRQADQSLPPPGTLSEPEMPPSYQQLQDQAQNMHPELKRLEAELRAGQSRINLAEKQFYPDIRVMAGYNGLWDEPQKQWTIGASINIPFDRDKYQAGVVAARAKAMQTRWELQDRRNLLLANLAQARAEVEESIGVIRLYRDRLIPLTEEKLNATLADYQAGLGDFLNVITAEDEKLKTELTLERAYADYVRRQAALERWAGTSVDTAEY